MSEWPISTDKADAAVVQVITEAVEDDRCRSMFDAVQGALDAHAMVDVLFVLAQLTAKGLHVQADDEDREVMWRFFCQTVRSALEHQTDPAGPVSVQ